MVRGAGWGRARPILLTLALQLLAVGCSDDDQNDRDRPPWPSNGLLKGPYLARTSPQGAVLRVEVNRRPEGDGTLHVWPAGDERGAALEYPLRFAPTPGNGQPAPGTWLGEATVQGLTPVTKYEYSASFLDFTECGTFWTTARAGDYASFSFVAYGDSQTYHEAHKRVVRAVLADEGHLPHFVVHAGDLLQRGDSLQDWETFFLIERELLRTAPLYSALGNHDQYGNRAYFNAFFDPTDAPGEERVYTFTHGRVGFLVLDFMLPLTTRVWLDRIASLLDGLRQEGASLLFVVIHHPIYTFSDFPEKPEYLSKLVPVLRQAGVAVTLSGHNHTYEHFLVEGIHHLTVGGAGGELDEDRNVVDGQRRYEVMSRVTHHHLRVDVDGDQATLTVVDDDRDRVLEIFQVEARPPRPRAPANASVAESHGLTLAWCPGRAAVLHPSPPMNHGEHGEHGGARSLPPWVLRDRCVLRPARKTESP